MKSFSIHWSENKDNKPANYNVVVYVDSKMQDESGWYTKDKAQKIIQSFLERIYDKTT